MNSKKAAVFILLGQSNAVGHGVPMESQARIREPLRNVFGLHRRENQSFDIRRLSWSGYTSDGMNLAEEQDDTYSVANCLAALWQRRADTAEEGSIPDLYIIQIAIGAEGITEGYMWHPAREPKLIPGVLGTVDISLFPFCRHIFSLLDQSMRERNTDYEIIGLHWRGGENDVTATSEYLSRHLEDLYTILLDGFNRDLNTPPVILHRLVCPDRMQDMDPTGGYLERMEQINGVFDALEKKFANVSILDARRAPQYRPNVRGNGLFIEDAVHFTPQVNQWGAEEILGAYLRRTGIGC